MILMPGDLVSVRKGYGAKLIKKNSFQTFAEYSYYLESTNVFEEDFLFVQSNSKTSMFYLGEARFNILNWQTQTQATLKFLISSQVYYLSNVGRFRVTDYIFKKVAENPSEFFFKKELEEI